MSAAFYNCLDDIMSSEFTLDDCPRMGPLSAVNMPTEEEANESGPAALTMSSYRRGRIANPATAKASVPKGPLFINKEPLTGDPLDNTLRPHGTSSWDVIPRCPVPGALPKLNLKKGTTTLGFRFDGGVVLAVDSRASSGQYIASQTVQKVLEINKFLLGTMAGGAADCQYWERVLGMECRLWQLRNGSQITVAAASKILAGITYAYRNHGLSMGTMVAGWDAYGPNLYYVDDQGTRIKHNLFSVGSGSIYAYGVLDAGYKPNMSVKEATDLAREAIFHATYRDGGSGGYVSVYHIHAPDANGNSWTKISRDDQTELYDRYAASQN